MKKYYRIELFPDANNICEQIVLMAAKNNAGATNFNLEHLEQMALFMKSEPPTNTAIIGGTKLHIDVADEKGSYETKCIIEEIELFETAKVVDFETVDDIPENFYSSPGLGDN